jgi:hypothetical protein
MQMTTLSILYFHARPEKPLYDQRFTSTQGKPPRKQEINIRIQNLLVVAVLVAGVTFAGAIQMPQQRDENDSTAFHTNTVSSLLDVYLCLDVWALNTSVVAAIILLLTNLNDANLAPFALRFSSLMVGGSIYMMCLSFFFAVAIALWGGFHLWVVRCHPYSGGDRVFPCSNIALYYMDSSTIRQPNY